MIRNHIKFARAVLARWGNQPAPLVAGAPGPSMEDVGPLIAWLTEQACQAADASQPADAGMLTWAAQVIGERVNEDAPVAGEVAELVAWIHQQAVHGPDAARAALAAVPEGEGPPAVTISALLHPAYEPGDGSADGAQIVGMQWWHPVMGCDSLQLVVDNARNMSNPRRWMVTRHD